MEESLQLKKKVKKVVRRVKVVKVSQDPRIECALILLQLVLKK